MIWQSVLDVIDAIESWIAGQSYWIQVVVLLGVLGPLCYLLAGLIDRLVESVFAWHSRRDQQPPAPDPQTPPGPGAVAESATSGAAGAVRAAGSDPR